MQEAIKIYTDGAARGNPGRAGWGAIIVFPTSPRPSPKEREIRESPPLGGGLGEVRVLEIGGRKDHATNNQMELTATIEGLKYLKKHKIELSVEIFADSKYVILGATEWIFNWQKNNWRNAAKKPVMNRELWEELFELTQEFKPKWQYVAGHGTDKWNNRADEIATSFADNEPVELKKLS